MPEQIGNITIPEITASGTFPLTTVYPWSYTSEPEVVTHQIGNANANLKIEQRFYIGPGAKKFFCRCQMNDADRISLRDFWEARTGPYQTFTYNAPTEAGSTTSYTVRFANEPLSFDHLAAALTDSGVWLVEVPDPASAPTYSISATQTRFPDAVTLAPALLSQIQQVIPLIKIQPKEAGYPAIYLSDRRVTVGGQLYQPRLLDWDGISQGIGGETDQARFSFGNADRVMRDLANDTDLWRASIEFSLFHVGTTIKLDLWKGEINTWGLDEGNEFTVSAADGLYELNLPYPERKIDRRCWKQVADGVNCLATGPTTCLKVYQKNAGETGNDCVTLSQTTRYGGVNVKPQGVYIKNTGAPGKPWFTATSVVNDSCYGAVLKEVYTDRNMPVNCEMAAGREENTFYLGMGIVGRGPLGSYATPAMVATDDGGQRFEGHTLDGQPHHGFGTANPTYGLRTSLGADPTADNFSLAGEGSEYAAGTAWIEIRRNDPKGIQPTKASEHQLRALVATGLTGWTWTAPGSRSAKATLTNPVWIAVNAVIRALGLDNGTAEQQEAVFDCAAAITAAGICNQTVNKLVPADGTTETQFKFIGVLGEQKPLRDWIQEILNNCCGYYLNSFGKLKIGIRFHSGSAEGGAFGEGNIILGSLSLQPIRPAFNWLTCQFGNADYDWQTDSVSMYDIDHADILGAVAPVFTQSQMNLAGTCTKSQAARIATTRLREELGGISASEWKAARAISFRTTILSLAVEAGMICGLTHDEMPGGTGEFRVTRWRLNKDYSIDIAGRTTTDSMYDLTTGPKPSDSTPDGLPGELIVDTMPGDVTFVNITETEDGLSFTADVEYEPPGTDDTDIGTFAGVVTHIEAPDASGNVQAGGEHDYDGEAGAVGTVNTNGTAAAWVSGAKFSATIVGRRILINSVRYLVSSRTDDQNLVLATTAGVQNGVAYSARTGTLRMVLPMPEASETWRLYLASKSEVYKKRLVLHGITGETPNSTLTPSTSEVVPAPPAPNQTWVTTGANETKVVYISRGVQTKWRFNLGVEFDTNAAAYPDLAEIEFFCKQTSPSNRDQILGYAIPPAASQGTVQVLWSTDEWPLPIGANDVYTLEMRCKNADGVVTANPPTVTGLTVQYSTGGGGANLTIPPVTGFTVTDWNMNAAQEYHDYLCSWTMPADMSNVFGVKFTITTPGPVTQDVSGVIPFPATAAGMGAFTHVISIARGDLPNPSESWTFKCVTINAAQDADNAATAPSQALTVGPPAGSVPDLMPPLAPTTVTGQDTGVRMLLGNNETYTTIRCTVTLPANHRATKLTLWWSDDGGTTWGVITTVWSATVSTFDFVERAPASTETDWKVKVATNNDQYTATEASAVVSAAFTVNGIGSASASLITDATVGNYTYGYNADGVATWGLEYISWTNPAVAGFFTTRLERAKCDASGNLAPDWEGSWGNVCEYSAAGAAITHHIEGWGLPYDQTYKYWRLRLIVITRGDGFPETTQTTAWSGAAYIVLSPTDPGGALALNRAAATSIGGSLSVGVPYPGGIATLNLANTNTANILPNGDFQVAHPVTASWVDKWTAGGNATRQTSSETGSYCIRFAYHASSSSITSERIRVTKNRRYSLLFQAKADSSPGGSLVANFRFYDPTGSYISGSDIAHDFGTLTTSWATYGFTDIIPSGVNAYFVDIVLYATPSDGKYYYVDRVEVTLVTIQQDQIPSTSDSTAVTLGQHLNGSSQFTGIAATRSTGWRSELRDDHLTVYCPSGRVLSEVYGSDSSPDYGYVIVKSDTSDSNPMAFIEAATPALVLYGSSGSGSASVAVSAGTGYITIDGSKVIGARQSHIANPSGGGTQDAEARTAINSILTALETHGLLASS